MNKVEKSYYEKYLKYKTKYSELKKQLTGGVNPCANKIKKECTDSQCVWHRDNWYDWFKGKCLTKQQKIDKYCESKKGDETNCKQEDGCGLNKKYTPSKCESINTLCGQIDKKICNDYRECENKSYTFSNSTEKTWICEPREIPLDGTQKSKTIYYS